MTHVLQPAAQTSTPAAPEGRAPGKASEAALRVLGLNVTYRGVRGEFHAVRDVSLEVGRGEQVAVVGESGSGKTSLGMAIAGYLQGARVSTEVFELEGVPVVRTPRPGLPVCTPGIGMIFQDAMTSLDPVWTIGSQLRAAVASSGAFKRRETMALARDWLRRVGLDDTDRVMKARPYELSGGMRQRAMMAIALCGHPRLLIADEPTSALDASLSRAAMDLMRGLAADTGTALLVISHDVKLCAEYTDRMVVMYQGEVVEEGPSAELTMQARHPYTRGLLACVPDLDSRRLRRLPVLADFLTEEAS